MEVRTIALRVSALALLLLLAIVSALSIRTLNQLPNSVVYFVETRETSFGLEPVGKRFGEPTLEGRLERAVNTLIRGPDGGESVRGLSSAVPKNTRLYSLHLVDGTVYVDLSSDFEAGGGSATMTARLNQLLYTLSQPEAVRAVSLSIEGAPVEVFSSEGLVLANPWYRREDAPLPQW
ncbi:MAG: GerMN domain-containing protein [Trueperaceae bacterium]|nr:GerMN domain-containing protein [Trueperaceae bacterium]